MNRRGQVLVIFVILLPLLILGVAYAVDTSLILYQKNKLDNLSELIIKYIVRDDLNQEEVVALINKNDNEVSIESIALEDEIIVNISKEVDSIFGKIIGKDTYVIVSIKKQKR